MKKKFIFLSVCFLTLLYKGQRVGINLADPQRTLDVNGNLRVTNIVDRSTVAGTDHLLAANRQNGNVDYIDIKSLQQSGKNNMEVGRAIYNAASADATKECNCGDIIIRFNGAKAEFKLKTTDVFTSNGESSFKLSYGIKRFSASAYSYVNKTDVAFQNVNSQATDYYNKYRNLDDIDFTDSTIGIYTLILPRQDNLYRITLGSFNNSSTTKTYSLICEKFYLQDAL